VFTQKNNIFTTAEGELVAVRHDIANSARESNFEGMEEEDIYELLAAHNSETSNEDLMILDLKYTYRTIQAMSLIDDTVEICLKNDPDLDRSSKVARVINSGINCYKELCRELTKCRSTDYP
jgi:hypothetical protein